MAQSKVRSKTKAKSKAKSSRPSAVESALALAGEHNAQMVDFKFVDLPGTWQHFTMPAANFGPDLFEEGLGFDGSSIRGWQAINESDMLVLPDPTTAVMDPFTEVPTLSLICSIEDPITRQPYARDPRGVAQRAQAYLLRTQIADTAFFGPEAEFFVFDNIQFDQQAHQAFYAIDSAEGRWNSGADERPNLGYKPDYKGGLLPRAADRLPARPPHPDGADDDRLRHRCGDSPPRSGYGRPRRNRHPLLSFASVRRPDDAV